MLCWKAWEPQMLPPANEKSRAPLTTERFDEPAMFDADHEKRRESADTNVCDRKTPTSRGVLLSLALPELAE